jgi:DNA-binding NtrC family response regulator
LTAGAAKVLLEYSWPGNVRELENLLQSTSLTVRGTVIDGPDLKLIETDRPASSLEDLLRLDYSAAIARLERMLLQHALQSAGGNRAEAARKLGIRRQLLYAKLKEHGL